jgi:branched-chain amino acid transport system ATP-binding protein
MTAEHRAAALLAGIDPVPGVAKRDPILVADGMRRTFGGLVAVDVEHLEIQRGVVTALIGPNGAGKTTLFNLLCGFDTPDAGAWVFRPNPPQPPAAAAARPAIGPVPKPVPLTGLGAHRIARAGMVRTFQLTRSFARLTVMENMLLAAPGQRGETLRGAPWRAWRATDRENTERAEEILDHFVLAHVSDQYAGALSGGQRKLLEMTRAVMAQPELLLLDEPLAGVNPVLIELIMEHVLEFPGRGMTVLYVEHNMDVVMTMSDWVICLAEGKVIAEGPPAEVAANPEVTDAYLGRE